MHSRAHRADSGAECERIIVALVSDQDHRERIARPLATAEARLGAIGKRRYEVGKPCIAGGDNTQAIDPERHAGAPVYDRGAQDSAPVRVTTATRSALSAPPAPTRPAPRASPTPAAVAAASATTRRREPISPCPRRA